MDHCLQQMGAELEREGTAGRQAGQACWGTALMDAIKARKETCLTLDLSCTSGPEPLHLCVVLLLVHAALLVPLARLSSESGNSEIKCRLANPHT